MTFHHLSSTETKLVSRVVGGRKEWGFYISPVESTVRDEDASHRHKLYRKTWVYCFHEDGASIVIELDPAEV